MTQSVKNPPANAEDLDLIPVQEDPDEGIGNTLQYSCLEPGGLWSIWPKGSDTALTKSPPKQRRLTAC